MTGRDSRGRFTSGNPDASTGGKARAARLTPERRRAIAAAGWAAIHAERAAALALLADIWARRASVSERGAGYAVLLDADLCERIRAALGE